MFAAMSCGAHCFCYDVAWALDAGILLCTSRTNKGKFQIETPEDFDRNV